MKVIVTLATNFPKGHCKAGQPTKFAQSTKSGRKIHTCRENYEYWSRKILLAKEVGGTLCVREWTGKPYRSPQGKIIEVAANEVGISLLTLSRVKDFATQKYNYLAEVDSQTVLIRELALNDGFRTTQEFIDWVEPIFRKHRSDKLTLGIIHFTPYRYGNTKEASNHKE